jgi:phage tail-like protein
MTSEDFKVQIFKTRNQWASGLFYRLEPLKDGGITLFQMPVFSHWILKSADTGIPAGLAVDACGQIYFFEADPFRFYKYDRELERIDEIPFVSDCETGPGKIRQPTRIIVGKSTLWVADASHGKILAFSTENFQLKFIISKYMKNNVEEPLSEPIDIGVDEIGNLYVLDRTACQILKYDKNGRFGDLFHDPRIENAIGLAVGRDNRIYLIDHDGSALLIYSERTKSLRTVPISGSFYPYCIVADKNGNVFVGAKRQPDQQNALCHDTDKHGSELSGPKAGDSNQFETKGEYGIHQFDPNGNHLGRIELPGFNGPICDLAVDSRDNFYAIGVPGIAFLSAEEKFIKGKAFYFSKTLDSGIRDCQWHRLALKARIPEATYLDVYYFADNNPELKSRIDANLKNPERTIQDKVKYLDKLIPWIGPESNPQDMLFRGKTGQYLWLKLVLSTFDEDQRPEITKMKLYYPRSTYLRYLPAIYQNDPAGKEFLERFLSIFESVFHDLEIDISQVFNYFDPGTTPANFLKWLAAWLNLALEEGWPEDRKRLFIQQAFSLYKLKGTLNGIEQLVKICTGKTPVIIEHSKTGSPTILDADSRLGINSVVVQTPPRVFRLGKDAILGQEPLGDGLPAPEAPFLGSAYRFTVVMEGSGKESSHLEKELLRIINEAKPAHTSFTLRMVDKARLGMDAHIGSTFKLVDYRPLRINVDSVLGTGLIAFDKGETSGKIERRSKVGVDSLLI